MFGSELGQLGREIGDVGETLLRATLQAAEDGLLQALRVHGADLAQRGGLVAQDAGTDLLGR
ncbi:MAG: hypothetical protein DRI90_26225, partial [Deltaproteobacteria bacterium]